MIRRTAALFFASVLLGGLVFPARAGAASAADLYGAAQKSFEQNLFAPASESLRALLRDYPDDALADDAEYLLALCRIYTSAFDQAARSLEQYPRRYPTSPYLRLLQYWLGYARYSQGQVDAAITAFRAQVDRYPAEARYRQYALSYLGELYERRGELDAAMAASRDLLASGAGGEIAAVALYRVGSISFGRRAWGDAQAAFSRIRLEHPESPLAAASGYYEAEALYQRGEKTEAARRFEAYLQASRGREAEQKALLEDASWRLVVLARDRGDRDALLAAVGSLEASFPSSDHLSDALAAKAEALVDRGDFRGARSAYAAALERVRDQGARQRLQFNAAVCSISLGDQASALQGLEAAASGPDTALAAKSRYRQAVVLAGQGAASRALPILTGLVAAGGAEEEVLRFSGGLLDEAGRFAESRAVWTELLSRFPASAYGYRYLFRRGAASQATGDAAGALEDWNALIRGYGDKPEAADLVAEARYGVGYVYSSRGEHARALPYFARALQAARDPDLRARCLYAQGVSSYNVEDFAAALAAFRGYLDVARDGQSRGRGLLSIGKTELRSGDFAGAAESLREAANLLAGAEEGAESLSWLGSARTRQGDAGAARDAYLELARRYPASPRVADAYVRAGVSARAIGELAASLECLGKALDLLPAGDLAGPREEALFEAGSVALDLGRVGDARRLYGQIGREYPQSALAPQGLLKTAQVSFEAGRFREAASWFAEVARAYPKSEAAAPATYWAAESTGKDGDASRAAELYWDYLKRYPAGAYAAAAESGLADMAGSTDEPGLLKRLFDAAEADAGVPASLASRVRLEYATALLARGNAREAETVSGRIDVESLAEPYRGEALLLQARLERRKGSVDRALTILRGLESARTDRVGAEALLELGETLGQTGKGSEAVTQLLRLTSLYPKEKELVPRALYDAILIMRASGDKDGADRLSARLAEEYPGYKPPR